MMSVVVHDQPVICTQNEFAQFSPPQGMTCQQWAGPYVQQQGGYLQDPGNTTLCQYCQYANGDEYVFVSGIGSNLGCICECILFTSLERLWDIHVRSSCSLINSCSGYIFFNIAIIFLISWLFFGGYKKFIPSKAVAKVMRRGSVSDESDETQGRSNARGESERQYLKEGQSTAG
jgi:ATP-binding cassette, subfamily G (WHITE), member 2, SNQ2